MDIRLIKLDGGQELLSQIEINVDEVTLTKPMVLIMGQQGVQMVPWLMLAQEETVTIPLSKTVVIYEARAEVVAAYQEQVGSIVQAPANALDEKGKLVL